jgi:hypothetical protein
MTATDSTDPTKSYPVYIKGTITSIDSTTRLHMTSHGYEDVLPVESIKSTINQSSESIKIAAKHVDIEGAAIFKKGGAYDKSATVVKTETEWYSSNNPNTRADGA